MTFPTDPEDHFRGGVNGPWGAFLYHKGWHYGQYGNIVLKARQSIFIEEGYTEPAWGVFMPASRLAYRLYPVSDLLVTELRVGLPVVSRPKAAYRAVYQSKDPY